MIKETTWLIFSIFLVFISINAICANDNSTFDDMLTADEFNQDTLALESGSFDDLYDLINSDDDVIELDRDFKYSSTDSVSSNGITINRSITINGNGHTIDASDSVRIFLVNSSNVILNNINFINGYSSNYGGAIYATNSPNLEVNNCNFENSNAYIAGALYSNSANTKISNSTFKNNTATRSAGAAYLSGSNSIVNNSNFDNNNATEFNGGALSIYGAYTTVENSNFTLSECYNCGGAIAWSGSRGTVRNSNFNSNTAGAGGSIFFFGTATYATVDNCTFTNDYCYVWGGSIYFYVSSATLTNSYFSSNHADVAGGAVYTDDYNMNIDNCNFENNFAKTGGGAIALFGSYSSIKNSNFTSNNANSHGGSIYAKTYNSVFDNLNVFNSSAASGGGIYFVYKEENTSSYSYSSLTNSRFINNTARYGGGAVTVTDHSTVSDCNFSGNAAGSYGGAIDTTNSILTRLILQNNSAYYGGAIYSYNSDIINSTFIDNYGRFANSIYVLNRSNIADCDVLDEDIIIYGNDSRGQVQGSSESDHDISHLMTTNSGYFAYCAERYNLSPYTGIHDDSMEKLKNSINNEPVAEYLKILIYNYVDHMDDLRNYDFYEYVWAFTDYEYWNSTDPIVQEVIRLYNSGFRVPRENACKVLSNGTLMYFNFSSMITPSGQQNLFLFKFNYSNVINETLDKEVLNKTAIVGDNIEFRIIITNKGTDIVYDNFIEDKDYSNGLVYIGWRNEVGDWSYDNLTGQWKLPSLEPGKSASIILIFKVLVNGTLYNNATSGVGNINVTNSSDSIKVYNPNFTVEKISLTPQVLIGDQTYFKIVVKNTGDMDLNNITVMEQSYEGLIFDHAEKTELWSEKIIDGKYIWSLDSNLSVGGEESFIVVFNTTTNGTFTNVIVASSNETGNKTTNNKTKVSKANLKVKKITLTPKVIIGHRTIFEIVVKNTGEVDLDNVFVYESEYDSGLTYLGYVSTIGNWKHEMIGGKHIFTLNGVLKVHNSASFRVIFNTTRIGNFSNTVQAGYNNTNITNSTNTTVVVNKSTPNVPENKTHKKTPNVENKTSKSQSIKTKINEKATGNPLVILLLTLILIPLRRFKK